MVRMTNRVRYTHREHSAFADSMPHLRFLKAYCVLNERKVINASHLLRMAGADLAKAVKETGISKDCGYVFMGFAPRARENYMYWYVALMCSSFLHPTPNTYTKRRDTLLDQSNCAGITFPTSFFILVSKQPTQSFPKPKT
jgi:hypothetical protein